MVAAVAATYQLPFVCIPAGTRNHLALDLGIDRDDPATALDAFGPARGTSIDLGEVKGEVFVNNVSIGLYAQIVASEKYREAKRRTVAEMLPDLVGPDAAPLGLIVEGPDGPIAGAQVIQVSNNPYRLSSLSGFGSRPSLNAGALGVATVTINRPIDVNRLVALEAAGRPERYEGWRQWKTRGPQVCMVRPHWPLQSMAKRTHGRLHSTLRSGRRRFGSASLRGNEEPRRPSSRHR